ncbi:MAG: hypothetical protein JWO42_17 [Chloroflexi bacterium]|jgi:hypothetical protein|nr:hypothetical protein [Chloroflexota bacterium]
MLSLASVALECVVFGEERRVSGHIYAIWRRQGAGLGRSLGYANADVIAVVNRVSGRNVTSFPHSRLYDRTIPCCPSWNQSGREMLPLLKQL